MKTTVLIVEFLVAGILVSLAVVFCAYSIFSDDITGIFNDFHQVFHDSTKETFNEYQNLPLSTSILVTTIFIAIAYGVGILSEYIGLSIFEGRLDTIKKNRMRKYLKELKENGADLEKNPILKKFEGIPPEKITKKQAISCIGSMRFNVLKESPELYQDIASQLHRLRLIRILFLVEVILLVGIVCLVGRSLLNGDFSLLSMGALIFFGAVAYANFRAIMSRFDRYCRAVERSYKALMFGM